MLATRTNENNSIRVTLVKWKWNSYPKVVPLNMWSILQQRNERECVLAIKLESKSNGNPSKNVWEGVRVRRVSMRAHHPSLGLYLKEFGRVHRRKSQAQRSGSCWRRWGLGAVGPFGQLLSQRSKVLKIWCTAKSLLEMMSKLFFPKGFWNLENIFRIFVNRKKC